MCIRSLCKSQLPHKSVNSRPPLPTETRFAATRIYLSIRCILCDIQLWVGDPSSRRVARLSTSSCLVSLCITRCHSTLGSRVSKKTKKICRRARRLFRNELEPQLVFDLDEDSHGRLPACADIYCISCQSRFMFRMCLRSLPLPLSMPLARGHTRYLAVSLSFTHTQTFLVAF